MRGRLQPLRDELIHLLKKSGPDLGSICTIAQRILYNVHAFMSGRLQLTSMDYKLYLQFSASVYSCSTVNSKISKEFQKGFIQQSLV
jgi:hypothetical protein